MIDVFEKNFDNNYIKIVQNNWVIDDLQVKPNEMYEIYNNSKFVPVGRGNHTLDCFRIYEAIVAGSIPVIVDDKNEAVDTFRFNDDEPRHSFIITKTWDEAVEKCKKLIMNPEELQSIQDANFNWWKSKILKLREIINRATNE